MPEPIDLGPYRQQKRPTPLHGGGGGGTFDGMSIVDAKIAAAEARTDTKFAELVGELRVIERSTNGIKATTVLTGISVVAVVAAILSWGTAMFGTGMDAQTVADRAAVSVEMRMTEQLQTSIARYEEMTTRLDIISSENAERWAEVLAAVKASPATP
jgi:hypothetical protein